MLFMRIMYIKEPVKRLLGLVPALMIKLGSLEVNAGINENPPVLISILPVWAFNEKAARIRQSANNCFIMIH